MYKFYKLRVKLASLFLGDIPFVNRVAICDKGTPAFNNLKNCHIQKVSIYYHNIKMPVFSNCNNCIISNIIGFKEN